MSGLALLLLVGWLGAIGWLAAYRRWSGAATPGGSATAIAWSVALATILPALLFLAPWSLAAPALVTRAVLADPAARDLPADPQARADLLAAARAGVDAAPPALAITYARAGAGAARIATAATLLLALAGAWIGWRRALRGAARTALERLIRTALAGSALAGILATVGIAATLAWGGARLFAIVPAADVLFGTRWAPQELDPARAGDTLGVVPVLWGTFLIGGAIAMAVAVPLGLLAAVHLSHYASARARRWLKPPVEVLAGVPTVVYGYLAAMVVAPAVRDWGVALGRADASAESALAAGLVTGLLVTPAVASLADDALAAVPGALGEASRALGATTLETLARVSLPAAAPGLTGAVLLALSRALGETMIVVMAASGTATLSLDPLAPATTASRQIVDLLAGEAGVGDVRTLAALTLGLLLFAGTLLVNVAALAAMRRRETADG